MGTTETEKKRKRWPKWAGPLAGWAGVLAGSAGLVYFWRVAFFLGEIPALPFTLLVAAIASVLYAAVLLAVRITREDIIKRTALLILLSGLLFVFATAPLQVPDEAAHYKRAYAISEGRFTYSEAAGFPVDVDHLTLIFGPNHNHRVLYDDHALAGTDIQEYREKVASGAESTHVEGEPVLFMLLPFLHQGLAMAIARLLGFKALGLMYAGRIANLLLYTLICWKALKNCDKYRGVFTALMLLPLSLFMAASCSYDSIMLAVCYLMVSYFCKKEIYARDVALFMAAAVFVAYIKPNNLVLVAVLLLIPKARWRTKLNPWLVVGASVAAGLVFMTFTNWLNGSVLNLDIDLAALGRGQEGSTASVAGQIGFILQNPLALLPRLVLTVFENGGFLSQLGLFGQLDMDIPLVMALSLMALCAASALGIQQKEDTKATGALALFLAFAFYSGAVLVGIYAAESNVGDIRVTGLQARYFLPAILLLFMLLSILLGKAVRPRLAGGTLARTEAITLWICFAVAIVSAVLIYQSTYIGQWRTSLDGVYKLTNMAGQQYL